MSLFWCLLIVLVLCWFMSCRVLLATDTEVPGSIPGATRFSE